MAIHPTAARLPLIPEVVECFSPLAVGVLDEPVVDVGFGVGPETGDVVGLQGSSEHLGRRRQPVVEHDGAAVGVVLDVPLGPGNGAELRGGPARIVVGLDVGGHLDLVVVAQDHAQAHRVDALHQPRVGNQLLEVGNVRVLVREDVLDQDAAVLPSPLRNPEAVPQDAPLQGRKEADFAADQNGVDVSRFRGDLDVG